MAKDYLCTLASSDDTGAAYNNTICVHDDELGGPRGPSSVVPYIDTWLTTKYRAILPPTTKLDAYRLFQIPAVYGDDTSVVVLLKGLAGTGAARDNQMGREMTLTLSMRSDHTSRRSMGRLSLPSPHNSAQLGNDGQWFTGGSYWAAVGTFADALLAGFDIGILGVDGHLSTRIYSRANHKDGSADKTQDVKTYLRRPRPRWLRRRVSIP